MVRPPDIASLQPVPRADIQLGVPIPYSVYDRGGVLLLKAGFKIHLERHLEILWQNGLYCDETQGFVARRGPVRDVPSAVEESRGSFALIDLVKSRLRRFFERFRAGRAREHFVERIEALGVTVQEACAHDADAVLANLNLDLESDYEVVHHVLAAVLCELIGKKLGVAEGSRTSLVLAALTHDIGLLDIQETLERQAAPLNAAQQAAVDAHPCESARLLRELGVRDAVWLDAVEHHHERIDGSGYPRRVKGNALAAPARVLAVADAFSAMVRDRPYRKAMVSRVAMRELMVEEGNRIDQRLTKAMIKEIGIFPPGVAVRLVSSEIAVIGRRGADAATPQAFAFVRPDGMPMLSLLPRDTARPEFAIEGIVPFSRYRGSQALIRSLWIG